MKVLQVENRQGERKVDRKFFSRALSSALDELLALESYEVAVHLVAAAEIARVNKQFLDHEGSTDVITFDLSTGYELEGSPLEMRGEIFISVEDAIGQAEMFGTSWQEEVFRYALHGFLHLRGYDDLEPDKRRQMKRKENALVRDLRAAFELEKLAV